MMKSTLGFTMIEMAIVLIMIGILTASLAPLLSRQHTNSLETADHQALLDAQTAIINYAISFGGIPNPTNSGATSGVNTGQMTAVSAFGVNNWGAFGSTTPFQMDVNNALASTSVLIAAGQTISSVGGDRVTFCQAVNQAMSSSAASPQVCSDYTTDHSAAGSCTAAGTVPVAFVLYSTGNDRKGNQLNATGSRVYENDKRGINNSNDTTSHYDDQVMSYPLSALARDCREKMGVAAEVMACNAGYKYVGSLNNGTAASGVSYNFDSGPSSSVPANFTWYDNACHASSTTLYVNVTGVASSVGKLSTLDANGDGRVDIFINSAGTATAQ